MTTVGQLFASANIERAGVVRWGERVPLAEPGVYVIATTRDAQDSRGLATPTLNAISVATLRERCREMSIDGRRADVTTIADRLSAMWPAGEPVLYVGLATKSVRRRTSAYYRTQIGASSPHAGGWPIQMLEMGIGLWVHYGAVDDPRSAERVMIRQFVDGVPREVASKLIDPECALPFANLEIPGGKPKKHGIRRGTVAPQVTHAQPSRLDAAGQTFSADLSSEDAALVERIDAAIAEFDRIGRHAFLRNYGFREARSYVLVVNGKRYDSKAILGAALGLKPGPSGERDRFHGGKHGAARRLRRLGYLVEGPAVEVESGLGSASSPRLPPGQVCESCFMVLPASGVCDCR